MKKKLGLLGFFIFIFLKGLIAQNAVPVYVIADQLALYQEPTLKAKRLQEIKSGTQVMMTGEGSSSVEVDKEINWYKILFQGQEGWVFAEGICERFLPTYFSEPIDTSLHHDWVLQLQNTQALVKELTTQQMLKLGISTMTFKAKNGKEVLIRESLCWTSDKDSLWYDGFRVNFIQRNTLNPSLIEVSMGMVAFDMKCYIDLEKGKKFNFPESTPCFESSISPSGKYVIGVEILSEQPTIALFDFDSQTLIRQIHFEGNVYHIARLDWTDEHTVEMFEINEEGKYLLKKTLRIDQ